MCGKDFKDCKFTKEPGFLEILEILRPEHPPSFKDLSDYEKK